MTEALKLKNTYLCNLNQQEPIASLINILQDAYKNNSSISLRNEKINESSLIPINKGLLLHGSCIISIDISFNQLFKDNCLQLLLPTINILEQLKSLNLEKTGVSDESVVQLVLSLPHILIESLNLSSTLITMKTFNVFTQILDQEYTQLINLDISNTKLTDRLAIPLLESIITKTQIEYLNVARNVLGFKTGTYLLSIVPKSNTSLKKINLNYNLISAALKKSINQLLYQMSYDDKRITDKSAEVQDDDMITLSNIIKQQNIGRQPYSMKTSQSQGINMKTLQTLKQDKIQDKQFMTLEEQRVAEQPSMHEIRNEIVKGYLQTHVAVRGGSYERLRRTLSNSNSNKMTTQRKYSQKRLKAVTKVMNEQRSLLIISPKEDDGIIQMKQVLDQYSRNNGTMNSFSYKGSKRNTLTTQGNSDIKKLIERTSSKKDLQQHPFYQNLPVISNRTDPSCKKQVTPSFFQGIQSNRTFNEQELSPVGASKQLFTLSNSKDKENNYSLEQVNVQMRHKQDILQHVNQNIELSTPNKNDMSSFVCIESPSHPYDVNSSGLSMLQAFESRNLFQDFKPNELQMNYNSYDRNKSIISPICPEICDSRQFKNKIMNSFPTQPSRESQNVISTDDELINVHDFSLRSLSRNSKSSHKVIGFSSTEKFAELVEGMSPLNIQEIPYENDNNTIKETSREDLEETRNVSKCISSGQQSRRDRHLSFDINKKGYQIQNLSNVIEKCLNQNGQDDLLVMRDTIADEIKRLQYLFNELDNNDNKRNIPTNTTQPSTERGFIMNNNPSQNSLRRQYKLQIQPQQSGRFIRKKENSNKTTIEAGNSTLSSNSINFGLSKSILGLSPSTPKKDYPQFGMVNRDSDMKKRLQVYLQQKLR